ncbi:hypothetical protein C8Q70DRAFT_913379 [Cubamyces menziesii]|nr:hypothetical protein C8Q70DRAFT_913379 [Cubamyces menziesii]
MSSRPPALHQPQLRQSAARTNPRELSDSATPNPPRPSLSPDPPRTPDLTGDTAPAANAHAQAAPVTAALATPHDAVLAEIQGPHTAPAQPRGATDPRRIAAPKLNVAPSGGSQERSDRTASPSPGGAARSTASSPGASQEALFDPFSGSLVGVMVPKKGDKEHERDPAATQFNQTREELWSRLASIRELQSAVASMHVQMEGTGLSDHRGAKRPAGVAGRVHTDTIHVDEDWDEPDGAAEAAEEQRKRARDAEFNDLSEAFRGRRKTIDDIMGKLGELSDALTTFHALPTPVMDFTNSRTNTKDSMPTSPDLALPTSPIASTAASPSPELPAALPRFVLSEADRNEGVLHESPVSAPGEVAPHAPAP